VLFCRRSWGPYTTKSHSRGCQGGARCGNRTVFSGCASTVGRLIPYNG
jgi:hypothetical protein